MCGAAASRHTESNDAWKWSRAVTIIVSVKINDGIVMAADSLVLATIPVAEDWLARELQDSGLEIHSIGDSVHPRRVHMAIHEGRKVGMGL